MKFLKYQYALLRWKQRKLKLGLILFIINEDKDRLDTLVILDPIEIKYIRQDTSKEDELKLQNILRAQGWHWNWRSYIALTIIIFYFFCEFYAAIHNWFVTTFPTLVYRYPHFNFILNLGFKFILFFPEIGFCKKYVLINYWVIKCCTDFCIHFNWIF